MTDETTPEISKTEDTSEITETNDTAADVTAPEVERTEPEISEDAAVEEAKTEPEPKLLAGKYKSVEDLEKAYKESEKFVTKAKEYEKQLQAYHENEALLREQREAEAKSLGFSDAAEQSFRFDVKNHEFQRYVQALETTLSGEAYAKAAQALTRYQKSGNPADLAAAQVCFSPSVISEIARDTARYENERGVTYQQEMQQRRFLNVKRALENFASEAGEWFDPKERQDIVATAIHLTGGDVDVGKVRDMIDAVEKAAVERYVAESKANAENKKVQDSLLSPSDSNGGGAVEHWLTREEYNSLTPEQESRQYDKIIKQIELEKAGKLPRALTAGY